MTALITLITPMLTRLQDTLWSAQDDAQLIGRLWRRLQTKRVHVYRLIALGSPDVFLNNISFDKARIHQAFIDAGPALSKFL